MLAGLTTHDQFLIDCDCKCWAQRDLGPPNCCSQPECCAKCMAYAGSDAIISPCDLIVNSAAITLPDFERKSRAPARSICLPAGSFRARLNAGDVHVGGDVKHAA